MKTHRVLALVVMSVLILAFVSTGVFAAGRQAADSDIVRVGYAPSDWDPSDFHGLYGLGIEEALRERFGENGYEFTIRAAGSHSDHEEQLGIVEAFVADGYDFIALTPTAYDGQQMTYRYLQSVGVPYIIGNYRDPFPEEWGIDQPVMFSGYSHDDGGIATAEWVRDNYPTDTKIVFMYGTPQYTSYARLREELFNEFGFTIAYKTYADFQRQQAFDQMERIMAAHPDTDLVLTASSAMSIGAVEAAQANGWTSVGITGAGGTIEELLAVEDGRMVMVWARDAVAMGKATGNAIYEYLRGDPSKIPQTFDSPIRVIDSVDAINRYINPIIYEAEGLDFPR